jgi:hypothetical protein
MSNCLPLALTLDTGSVYFSTLKMEATCSYDTLIEFQRTARRYILDDRILLCSNSAKHAIPARKYKEDAEKRMQKRTQNSLTGGTPG